MKKLTIILLCAVSITSFAQKSTQKPGKPGWATAVVDAGGALAGGGMVLELSGGTAAVTPWGWAATGLGAIIGGAAASVTYAVRTTANTGTSNNPDNNLNQIGVEHNGTVINYLGQLGTQDITPVTYLNYITKYKSDMYSYVNNAITPEYLQKQTDELNALDTDEKVIDWAVKNMPADVDATQVKDFLNQYKLITSKEDAVRFITRYENTLIRSNLKPESIELLKYYFATLRNSTLLW